MPPKKKRDSATPIDTVKHKDKRVNIGSHAVAHGEVLRACLSEGLCTPEIEPLDEQLPDPSSFATKALIVEAVSVVEPKVAVPEK